MSRNMTPSMITVGVALSFLAVLAVSQCSQAQAKGSRDKVMYPPRPTWQEAIDRTTAVEERTMLRIAHCEMGAQARPAKRLSPAHPPVSSVWSTVRWGLSYSKYSTGFGVWNGNFPEIRRMTSYSLPGSSPAQELLGVVALARKYGFSAWACHGK